jgi:DNA helicase-2/ATP-dependent DNA helicase PcrA
VNKNPNTIDVLDVAADSAASVGVISRSGFRRKKIDAAFAASTVPCRRWDLAIEDPTILERLRTVVAGMPLSTTVRQARAQVLEGIDPSDVETIEQVEDAFEQLSLRGESMSVRAALDQFRARTDDAAIGPGVHLLSAHTGKGQQFDWVFVIGLEEGHVPDHRCTGDDELAEEERVLLVMLSRARHGIVTTRARMKEGRFGPWEVGASPWWSDLAGTATMNWNALKAHLEQCYPSQDKAGDVSTLAASH